MTIASENGARPPGGNVMVLETGVKSCPAEERIGISRESTRSLLNNYWRPSVNFFITVR